MIDQLDSACFGGMMSYLKEYIDTIGQKVRVGNRIQLFRKLMEFASQTDIQGLHPWTRGMIARAASLTF